MLAEASPDRALDDEQEWGMRRAGLIDNMQACLDEMDALGFNFAAAHLSLGLDLLKGEQGVPFCASARRPGSR
ncbi:hypothetical protein [Sphingomonas oleivorans]|uniref:hypothetical protein n=1 Tax=Sphingomonas oleivorans TaxID=1735121 RepID=UPI0010570646|nr:hypothetical protein [Sphingomonas oleivorans]